MFARVAAEQDGRLDLVVANAWGGYESNAGFTDPFWEQPMARWDAMFTAGLRAQFATARAAAPAMVARGAGLIVVTGGTDLGDHYLGNVPYDVVKAASTRLVVALAHELRPHGVAAVGVHPGFTRTEAVIDAFAQQGAEPPPETHSPEFVGRAVASVLADPDPMRLSGTGAQAADFARRYGFADVDGRTIAPFALPDDLRLTRRRPRRPRDGPSTRCPACRSARARRSSTARRARRCRRSAPPPGTPEAEDEQRERHRRHALRPEPGHERERRPRHPRPDQRDRQRDRTRDEQRHERRSRRPPTRRGTGPRP